MKENKKYEITKSSRRDWIGVTFQCHIINKGVNVAPKWFRDFATKQEEFNKYVGGFIRKQEEFNKAQLEFNKYVGDFIKQQIVFNKHVTDVFQRNNLK
ncbi:MAG: hypothetical protein LBG49_02285 [Mycoplasmataceae bacterium]|jgi:nitrate/TMAO reductase-like tetraheme cytochrome c subunit|nr:hypothetical protein [Mycoplasmataceae bacterium]